ncbi:MAG: transglutaminase domain-containing protein [Puia sp.]|nr:transglutaminase domain-containing protein [Puia sp.]
MALRQPFRLLKKILKNLYFLTFLNGFLIASLFYFRMEGNYEDSLFASIKRSVDRQIDADDTQDSIVVKTMHVCNELLHNRARIFSEDPIDEGVKSDYFHPTSVDLMTTRGACGSYSMVLARLLQLSNYPIRIAQMKAHGIFAAHNVIEVYTNTGWAVLDPTFNVYFKKPGHSGMASFADVESNWKYYISQLPAGYDTSYKYEDVRYTNWEKIPVVLPAAKKLLGLFIGSQKVDKISIRTYFLRMYNIYFVVTLLLYIPIFLLTFKRFVKTKIFPRPDIPITFANLIKYSKPHFATAH